MDPFDGGPHIGCPTKDIFQVKHGRKLEVSDGKPNSFEQVAFFGLERDTEFIGGVSAYSFIGEKSVLA